MTISRNGLVDCQGVAGQGHIAIGCDAVNTIHSANSEGLIVGQVESASHVGG